MKLNILLFFFFSAIFCYEIIEDEKTEGFKYRQDITVTNTGNSAIDKISLEIDGAELVSKNLFQSASFYDIRFKTGTKNGTIRDTFVNHWFETSFNKKKARVWVELEEELAVSEQRKVFMYMGANNTESFEMVWDGEFITMKEGGCISQEDEYTQINDYFVKFGTLFGETTSYVHSHTIQGESNAVGKTEDSQGFAAIHPSGYFFDTHSHKFDYTTTNEVFYPLHQKMPFCRSSKSDIEDNDFYFTTLDDNSDLPYGYEDTIFSTTPKFIMGGSNFMEDGDDKHTHAQISVEGERSDSPIFSDNLRTDFDLWDQSKPTGVMLKNHTHTTTVNCDQKSSVPAYKTVVVVKVEYKDIVEPNSQILFIADKTPPIGFSQYTNFDSSISYRAGANTNDESLIGSHTHSCTVDLEVETDIQFSKNGGDWGVLNQNHDHQSTVEISSAATIELPSFSIFVYQREENSITAQFSEIKQIGEDNGIIDFILNNLHFIIPIGAGIIGGIIILIILVIIIIVVIVCCIIQKQKTESKNTVMKEVMRSADQMTQMMDEKDKEIEEKEKIAKQLEDLKKENEKLKAKEIKAKEMNHGNDEKSSNVKLVKIDDFELNEKMGRGMFLKYSLYSGKYEGNEVSIRKFDKDVFEHSVFNIFEFFQNELKEYSKLNHSNILKFLAYTKTPDVCVASENVINGHLQGYIAKNKKGSIKQNLIIMKQITEGMIYLHSQKIVHKDLRLENIFLTDNNSVKIDFGFNKTFKKNYEDSIYAAPELIKDIKDDDDDSDDDDDQEPGNSFEYKCDVYSFGIIMLQLFTGKIHIYGRETKGIAKKVADDEEYRPKIEQSKVFPGFAVNLCKMCLKELPSERPSFQRLRLALTGYIDNL